MKTGFGENRFGEKVQDFIRWCEIAFHHYRNGLYADALTNMRKSGEAVCKLIIIFRLPEKIAENRIGQKNYKELIETVIREDLATRKIINWLETLQIHGNIATHDNNVMKEQANYSIFALRLLIISVFEEILEIPVPPVLTDILSQADNEAVPKTQMKKIETELRRERKERNELEKQLLELSKKAEAGNEKTQQYSEELKISAFKSKELEKTREKIICLEEELSQYKRETDVLKLPGRKKTVVRKIFSRQALIYTTLVTTLLTVFFLLSYNFFFSQPVTEISENTTASKEQLPADTFSIIVFPFTILQDNPNIRINFEEALVNRIRQKTIEMKLPINITYLTSGSTRVTSFDEAKKEILKLGTNIALFGEIYESSGDDSVQVNVMYSVVKEVFPFDDKTGIKSFKRLTDSSAIRIMEEIECMLYLIVTEHYRNQKKYSDALALLYRTNGITLEQKMYVYGLLSDCHLAQNNNYAAIKCLEKLICLMPDSADPYAFMANALFKSGRYDDAEGYYIKSLQLEPDNTFTILNYANMLVAKDKINLSKAKELCIEAIMLDSTIALAWRYLAEIEKMMDDYTNAKKHFAKSLTLNSTDYIANLALAEIYTYQYYQPEKGLEYINYVLRKDSNNLQALFLLANLYTNTSLKDVTKAAYLYKKCDRLSGKQDLGAISFGQGILCFDRKEYRAALPLFLKAFTSDSLSKTLSDYIAQTYIQLRDYANAEKFLMHSFRLDSMFFLSNYNLGYFYYTSEGKYSNMSKAVYYFEKELKTYPYDTLAMQNLYSIFLMQKKLKKADEILAKIYSVNPNSLIAHKGYGYLHKLQKNYSQSLSYFQKAVKTKPDDWEAHSQLALAIMHVESDKNLNKASFHARRAVELNPASSETCYIYSQVLFLLNNLSQSADYYYKAVSTDPSCKNTEMEKIFQEKGINR